MCKYLLRTIIGKQLMDESCLFCNIRDKPYYLTIKIAESQYFFSIFDVHPVSPGHALIIPKRHVVSLLDLSASEWSDLRLMQRRVIKQIEKTDFVSLYRAIEKKQPTDRTSWFMRGMFKHFATRRKPEGYNIGNNEGAVAGRTVHHLHIQIIPRYKGDVENSVGGIRTIIPQFGDYKRSR